ncbi:hypothetical protein ACFRAR_14845 [Kitasatospora sp. NPDC056651]|uniref:hypothetical protein n=1 Tax=Kitasatospora sp. NPDC056651 TaxID=3345892 RepID=UPI0036BDD7CF
MKKTMKKVRRLAVGTATAALALTATLVGAGSATAAEGYQEAWMNEPGILYKNQWLTAGDTQLVMQGDGNLVLYVTGSNGVTTAPWATRTIGCGDRAIMQGDGNFVVYGAGNKVCWTNNVFKTGPGVASLRVHSGGGLHIELGQGSTNFFMHQLTLRLGSSDPY